MTQRIFGGNYAAMVRAERRRTRQQLLALALVAVLAGIALVMW